MTLSKWFPFKFNRKDSASKAVSSVPVHHAPSPQSGLQTAAPLDPFRMMQRMLGDPFFADPFSSIGSLQRWFGDFGPSTFQPSIDVVDRGQVLEVSAELPGMGKDDVRISIDDDMLTLSGEKRVESTSQEDGCYRVERAYGSFYRVVPLPGDVDRDKIEATFKDGVLRITVPKNVDGTTRRSVPIS